MLVRVRAAGVNPVDTYVRGGTYALKPDLPYVVGCEGAGETSDGRRVCFLGTAAGRLCGATAEWAAVPRASVFELPAWLSFEQGAAVPVAYSTARRALHDRAHARRGEVVLVHGASGGVGTAAVQLANKAGCVVLATAGSEEGRALAETCGAVATFDHRRDDYLDALRAYTGSHGVDVVIEMLANVNLDRDLDLLAHGGRVVVVGNRGRVEIDPRKAMAKEASVLGMTLWGAGDEGARHAVNEALHDLADPDFKWTPRVAQAFALDDVRAAHERVISGAPALGKLVVTL